MSSSVRVRPPRSVRPPIGSATPSRSRAPACSWAAASSARTRHWPRRACPTPRAADRAAGADRDVGGAQLRWVVPRVRGTWVKPTGDGVGLDFTRPPRIVEPMAKRRHRVPARPVYSGKNPFPLLIVLMPMAMGLAFVYFFHNLYFAMFALFSPVFGLANWISGRRNGKKDYKRRLREY